MISSAAWPATDAVGKRPPALAQCSGFDIRSAAAEGGQGAPVGGIGCSYCLLLDGAVLPLDEDDAPWAEHLPDAEEIAQAAAALGGRVHDFYDDEPEHVDVEQPSATAERG